MTFNVHARKPFAEKDKANFLNISCLFCIIAVTVLLIGYLYFFTSSTLMLFGTLEQKMDIIKKIILFNSISFTLNITVSIFEMKISIGRTLQKALNMVVQAFLSADSH